MEIIAHRGASFDAPENSLAAVESAIAQGADRVEVDIHATRDGAAVVSHDSTTMRCGDRDVVIAAATLDEVRSVTLSNGEPIPTLDDVCKVVRGRASIDAEIKGRGQVVVEETLRLIARHGLLDDALITSFDETTIRAARRLGYQGRLGLLAGSRSLRPSKRAFETWPLFAMRRCGADALVIHHKLAHPALRWTLRKQGIPLYLWMSMEDEFARPELREIAYRRIDELSPHGAIVGRVAEVRYTLALSRSQNHGAPT